MKKIEQTIYNCDRCHEDVIETFQIQRKAEDVGTATFSMDFAQKVNVPLDLKYCLEHDSIVANPINTFYIPYIKIDDGVTGSGIEINTGVRVAEKHVCGQCGKELMKEYIELVLQFRDWANKHGLNVPSR